MDYRLLIMFKKVFQRVSTENLVIHLMARLYKGSGADPGILLTGFSNSYTHTFGFKCISQIPIAFLSIYDYKPVNRFVASK